MKITIKLHGYLPSKIPTYNRTEGIILEVEDRITVKDVIAMIPLESSECSAISSEGIVLSKNTLLLHSTTIQLFSISSGG